MGLKAFFDMVHIDPKKLILFGAACSPVTDQIARAAKHWNLVQVIFLETRMYDYKTLHVRHIIVSTFFLDNLRRYSPNVHR